MHLPLLLLAGCTSSAVGDSFSSVWPMFPFDGARTWDYVSTDPTVGYTLRVTSSGEPDVVAGTAIYTLVSTTTCFGADPDCVDGEVLRRMEWSSNATDGVGIHGYDIGAGFVPLEPPVRVTLDDMSRDDAVETVIGSATWTSTMLGVEPCPGPIGWDECGAFRIVVEGADGGPIAGTWWATPSNGVAAFELLTDGGQWQLTDLACEGDCDGSW